MAHCLWLNAQDSSQDRAVLSFQLLRELFCELGLEESVSKAYEPSTRMPYLGVEFDTVAMTMSVPGEKLEELRADLNLWLKRKPPIPLNIADDCDMLSDPNERLVDNETWSIDTWVKVLAKSILKLKNRKLSSKSMSLESYA